MNRWVVSAVAAMGMLSVSGCEALSKKSVTCLSADGQDVVLEIIKDEIEKASGRAVEGDDGRALVTVGNLRASIASIIFTIDDVRTSKEDPDSTKKFCAGTLKAVAPVQMIADAERVFELTGSPRLNDLVDQYGAERSANTIEIPFDFTVQPTDDRKNVYGEVEAPGSITSLFSALVTAHALKSRIEQAKATEEQAQAEQARLEAEAKSAERAAALSEARSRFQLTVQQINAVWQAIPDATREMLTPQQTAFNRRKGAACALEASQYSTDPTDKQVARLNCESQMMATRANELSRYVQYDGY